MTRPAGFEPLEEGWAALTEALAAAGVHVDEITARHAARAAVIDTMQRGWAVSHTDHARTIRAEVEAAVRPLREQLLRAPAASTPPPSVMPIGPAGSSTAARMARLSDEVTHR